MLNIFCLIALWLLTLNKVIAEVVDIPLPFSFGDLAIYWKKKNKVAAISMIVHATFVELMVASK